MEMDKLKQHDRRVKPLRLIYDDEVGPSGTLHYFM